MVEQNLKVASGSLKPRKQVVNQAIEEAMAVDDAEMEVDQPEEPKDEVKKEKKEKKKPAKVSSAGEEAVCQHSTIASSTSLTLRIG